MNLLRLSAFTGEGEYRKRADALVEAWSGYLTRAPAAVPRLLCALDFATGPVREVVLSGEPGRPDFEALRSAVFSSPGLNRVLVHADATLSLADVTPLVLGRAAEDGLRRGVRLRELRLPEAHVRPERARHNARCLSRPRPRPCAAAPDWPF